MMMTPNRLTCTLYPPAPGGGLGSTQKAGFGTRLNLRTGARPDLARRKNAKIDSRGTLKLVY